MPSIDLDKLAALASETVDMFDKNCGSPTAPMLTDEHARVVRHAMRHLLRVAAKITREDFSAFDEKEFRERIPTTTTNLKR